MKKRTAWTFGTKLTAVLLLVVCVGGSQLLVCKYADPDVYERIMEPVRRNAAAVAAQGKQAVAACGSWLAERFDNTEGDASGVDSQLAGDPAQAGGGETITDPQISELTERGGQEILTGGSAEIDYFAQSDPAWREKLYGSDTIGSYGCGPTAMAMAVSSLTAHETDPVQMSNWAYANGYYARGSGSYHSIVSGAAAAFGLKAEGLRTMDANELRTQLAGGRIGVALMKAGHFTSGGHFIVLRGVTLEGNILVADPNSRARSLQSWDAQLVLNELSDSRDNGAPLWILSPA